MTTGTNIFEYIKEINQYLVKVKSHSCNSVCKPIKERDRLKCSTLEVNIKCIVFLAGIYFWSILANFENSTKFELKLNSATDNCLINDLILHSQ